MHNKGGNRELLASNLKIGVYLQYGSNMVKKKFEALALQPFEKIDFKVLKKIIYISDFFFLFLILIAPSDRKSCEDHESPHF